jgi:TPP-dependent pyruvate/acetoin dehydrogenase alpha subunit
MTPSLTKTTTDNDGFSLISNAKLIALYTSMLACRRISEKSKTSGKKKPGSAESIVGHEAAMVGSAIDLLPNDAVAPALWPETALMAINPSASIAGSIGQATRSAAAESKSGKITLLFTNGRQSTHAGWLKALTLAAERNLPMLFISLNSPALSHISENPLPLKRKGYSLPVIRVDGDDVVAVYRVASEAIVHARKGHGPTLIDCQPSASGDPIQNMREYLIGKGLDPG